MLFANTINLSTTYLYNGTARFSFEDLNRSSSSVVADNSTYAVNDISGAAGGVGVAAVQIARALGAHVIAVTRTGEHHERLRECGADETVTLEQVSDLDRVDVVLELVGAANLSNAQRILNPFARVVVIGVSGGGSKVELDLRFLMGTRSSITGSTLRSRTRKEKGEVADRVNHTLVPRWRTGEVHVPVARTFSLDEVDDAYAFFAEPGKFGKVVLRIEG